MDQDPASRFTNTVGEVQCFLKEGAKSATWLGLGCSPRDIQQGGDVQVGEQLAPGYAIGTSKVEDSKLFSWPPWSSAGHS